MASSTPRVHPILPRFDRISLIYKTLNGTDFDAVVLVPKSLASSGKTMNSPLLVHFHGGGLMMGTPLDTEILSVWPLELAEAKDAIVVSPSYRLLPEAKGSDILDDVKDFWAWVRNTLPSEIVARWPHLSVDVERTAVFGESAGGYLSLQSAFLCPEANIKLLIPQYCAMFPDIDAYIQRGLPQENADTIAETYLKNIEPGAIRLHSPYWDFLPTLMSFFNPIRKKQVMGDDKRMTLGYSLEHTKNLPPIWMAQGTDDVIIPKEASDQLVDRIREAHPDTPLLYSVQPGPHGFEMDHTLETPWVAEGLEFVRKYWP